MAIRHARVTRTITEVVMLTLDIPDEITNGSDEFDEFINAAEGADTTEQVELRADCSDWSTEECDANGDAL
jgi:hypothetical protein